MKKLIKKILSIMIIFFSKIFTTQASTIDRHNIAYGIKPSTFKEPTLLEKIISIIFSPFFIFIFGVIFFIVGLFIYLKRKKKNVK